MEAVIGGEESKPVEGELAFVDNQVDRATGTFRLKATFANHDRRLWPGQFVNARVVLDVRKGAVVAAASAVQAGQQGPYVFVVKPDRTAEMRRVVIGASAGDFVVDREGAPGGRDRGHGRPGPHRARRARRGEGSRANRRDREAVVNTALFIRRPVATTLVMLAILLAGAAGYRLLPVSDLPNVDFPTILVSASLPGASPETMAASVATPLEKQFSTIAGLDSMSSVNALGITQVTLQFALDRDIDAAAQDVAGRDREVRLAAAARRCRRRPPTRR